MVRRLSALACGLAAVSVLTGCASAQAKAEAPMPVLAPPDAPSRVIAEYEPDPPLPAEPVSAEAVTPARKPVRPPRRNPRRPGVVPDEAEGPPEPAPAQPALALQTTGANARANQSTRALLAKAGVDLGRVDYQALDADGRAQYDTARRFMAQADLALEARNVAYAGKLADKAAAMAAVLVR